MKVLLDEGVPRTLARLLNDHGIATSPFPNHWKGMTNGALLDAAQEAGFTVILTNDKNVIHQQPVAEREVALVVLPTNRLSVVIEMVDEIATAIGGSKVGMTVIVQPRIGSSLTDRGGTDS